MNKPRSITYNRNGATKTLPNGDISWTTLFFGFWPSITRGHWSLAWAMIAMEIGFLMMLVMMPASQASDVGVLYLGYRVVAALCRNRMLNDFYKRDGWLPPAKTKAPAPDPEDDPDATPTTGLHVIK